MKTENALEIDYSKAAQLSATFAVTIFLSLTILVLANNIEKWIFFAKILWGASCFFAIASLRMIDKIFDSQQDSEITFSLIVYRGRHLIQMDDRFTNSRFTYYIIGWVLFLAALFNLGCYIFSGTIAKDFSELGNEIFSNLILMLAFALTLITTILSITREFLFKN